MLIRHAAYSALALVLGSTLEPAWAASFNVTGNDTTAKTLAPASGATETGTVTAAGDLNIAGGTVAVAVTGGSGTRTAVINNSGKIRQTGTVRAIRANSGVITLNVSNAAGATISAAGDDAIQVSSAGSSFSLENSGTISSNKARAVNLRDIAGSNTITNRAGGLLSGTSVLATDSADAVRPGANGTVNNYGTIRATPVTETTGSVVQASGFDGIQADVNGNVPATGITLNNYSGALVSGRHGITGSASPTTAFTITVNNDSGATITGVNGSGINIDNSGTVLGNAAVTNSGTITGNYDKTQYNTGDGDGVDVDGLLTLVNNGIIRGTGASGNGSDGGGNNPEGVSIGGGSITNHANAEITGEDSSLSGSRGHGVLVDNSSGGPAFAATTVNNAGLIRGVDSYAIRFIGNFADSITNQTGGTIRGGGNIGEGAAIQMGDGADTLINRGTISGDNGLAVDMEAGNDTLQISGGSAAIHGDISGGAGSNRVEIDGSFSYGGAFSNLAALDILSGAVTLTGASTYAGPTTVSGGQLIVGNGSGKATGNGQLLIHSGATLAGSGTVGSTTLQRGATLAPGVGVGVGTLGVDGDLQIEGGANLIFDVGFSSDLVNVSGTLSASGSGTVTVNISNNGIVAGRDYTLVNFGAAQNFTSAHVALGALPSGVQATLEVTGNALILQVAADLGVSASSLSFGSSVVGISTAEQTVTLSYSGGDRLNVGTPTLGGTASDDYTISRNGCGSPVAPGGSCSIDVRFTPTATGSRPATLSIPSNSASSPTVVELSGSGMAPHYSLQPSPASISFGNQVVGSGSSARSVMLSNDGNAPVTVTGFVASGSHPADFALAADQCSGQLLAVNASCSVSFVFTPAAAGSRSATETVATSPALSTGAVSLSLAGTGTQAVASLNPQSLNFGSQVRGSNSLPQTLTLSNSGNSALSVSSISASGDFAQANTCGAVLAAGGSCDIDVRFTPTATGPRSGSLSVLSSAPGSPTTAALSGVGTQAAISVSGSTGFGTVTVGSSTAPQTLTVSNTGTATLDIGAPGFAGAAAGDYTVASNGCSSGLAPTTSCSIGVRFTPGAVGERHASLLISSNAPGSPLSIPVTGHGVAMGARPGKLGLASASLSGKETAGRLVFKVSRSGGSDGAVSLDYATSNGSALAGQDYTASSGTLSWADGDASPKLITVPVTDDFVVEGKETITLTVSSPTGGATLARGSTVASLISDDQPGALSFSASALSVGENAGMATITVRRTGGLGDAVSVRYATANGTAQAGSDYTATAGDLSWAAGDATSRNFTVPILWDRVVERPETFTVVLSAPLGGAKLGSPRSQRVTIGNVNR